MKVATLDLPLAAAGTLCPVPLAFQQPAALDGFDTVIWDPAGGFPAIMSRLEQASPPVLSASASGELLATARHWRHEFRQLLQRGGTIVALLPARQTFGVHTLQEIIDYEPLEPLAALLPLPVTCSDVGSAAVRCNAGDPFRTFFDHVADDLQPQARLAAFPGIAVLEDAAGAALASYVSLPPGRVLLLPRLAAGAIADPDHATRFIDALLRCLERLGCTAATHNARWLEDYRTPAEQALINRQSALRERIHALQKELDAAQRAIDQVEFYKQLAGGEGPGLRIVLAELFRGKGAFVQQDWLVEGLLIVELDHCLLAVKAHLPEEQANAAYFSDLERARARIADYFSKPALALLADCAQNDQPLDARRRDPEAARLARAHGAFYLQGAHLYGWHMLDAGPDPDALIAGLSKDAAALLDTLWQSASASLIRAVAPSPEICSAIKEKEVLR